VASDYITKEEVAPLLTMPLMLLFISDNPNIRLVVVVVLAFISSGPIGMVTPISTVLLNPNLALLDECSRLLVLVASKTFLTENDSKHFGTIEGTFM